MVRHNLGLGGLERSEEASFLNAGMDQPEKPCEPVLPSRETSPQPCQGWVWEGGLVLELRYGCSQ